MGILKVARIGHPAVRRGPRACPPRSCAPPALQRLIDDMVDTMHEYDGVGLAAPAGARGLRLAVIEVPGLGRARARGRAADGPREPAADAAWARRSVDGWEGCLSIPDLRGVVPRAKRRAPEGARPRAASPSTIEAAGFFARVIQHECDHLDGRVYLDRMRDLCRSRTCTRWSATQQAATRPTRSRRQRLVRWRPGRPAGGLSRPAGARSRAGAS